MLILAAVGIGGFLLYKHFRKGGSVDLAGTKAVDVDDDEGDDE